MRDLGVSFGKWSSNRMFKTKNWWFQRWQQAFLKKYGIYPNCKVPNWEIRPIEPDFWELGVPPLQGTASEFRGPWIRAFGSRDHWWIITPKLPEILVISIFSPSLQLHKLHLYPMEIHNIFCHHSNDYGSWIWVHPYKRDGVCVYIYIMCIYIYTYCMYMYNYIYSMYSHRYHSLLVWLRLGGSTEVALSPRPPGRRRCQRPASANPWRDPCVPCCLASPTSSRSESFMGHDWCPHGSHHPTMNGIWSIMATVLGDVQYSQNGTVTNPC